MLPVIKSSIIYKILLGNSFLVLLKVESFFAHLLQPEILFVEKSTWSSSCQESTLES